MTRGCKDKVMDIVVGRQPVKMALTGQRRVYEILLLESLFKQPFGQELLKAAKEQKIPVVSVNKQVLDNLSQGVTHQGVLAKVEPFTYLTLSDAETKLKAAKQAKVVLLDGVTDPQNLGAISRCCLAFNVDFVFLPKRRTALVTPAAVKAAAGATEHLKFVQANLAQTADRLKALGFWLYTATPDAPNSITEISFSLKSGFVFGSEGKGVSALLRKKSDHLFYIPISSKIGSLNVAATVAITLAVSEGIC